MTDRPIAGRLRLSHGLHTDRKRRGVAARPAPCARAPLDAEKTGESQVPAVEALTGVYLELTPELSQPAIFVAPTGLRRAHRNASETASISTRQAYSESRGVDGRTSRQRRPSGPAPAAPEHGRKEFVGSRSMPAVRAIERQTHRPLRDVPGPLSAMRRLSPDICRPGVTRRFDFEGPT